MGHRKPEQAPQDLSETFVEGPTGAAAGAILHRNEGVAAERVPEILHVIGVALGLHAAQQLEVDTVKAVKVEQCPGLSRRYQRGVVCHTEHLRHTICRPPIRGSQRTTADGVGEGRAGAGMHWKGGRRSPPTPTSRAPSLRPATVSCVSVWSWSVLQFALQDLKIVTIRQILHVHPLFVLYCIVCYKSVWGRFRTAPAQRQLLR